MSTTLVRRFRTTIREALHRLRTSGEAGMTTAEYAVGTLAACAIAAVLFSMVKGDFFESLFEGLFKAALNVLT